MRLPMPLVAQFFVLAAAFALYAGGGLSFTDWNDEPFGWVMAGSVSSAMRRGRGRPRKFAAPSRAVTLTLPEWVLSALSDVHQDLSKAVVQLLQRRPRQKARPLAELSIFGRNAVITVRPTPSLERRAGVRLVPLPDGRALLSFDQPTSIADLELTLHDALEDEELPGADREVFEAIIGILKEARRSRDITLHRRNIIVLESNGAKARSGGR
jgi:hypothetical protein